MNKGITNTNSRGYGYEKRRPRKQRYIEISNERMIALMALIGRVSDDDLRVRIIDKLTGGV
jgi:hypothetical protein